MTCRMYMYRVQYSLYIVLYVYICTYSSSTHIDWPKPNVLTLEFRFFLRTHFS